MPKVDKRLGVHPVARLLAVVPVVIIAGGFIAFMLGYRLEGRRYEVLAWRTHAVAENNFTVATPGMFIARPETIRLGAEEVLARSYEASDRGVAFLVLAARRPDSDTRPPAEVAESLGLSGTPAGPRADGLQAFADDAVEDGARTQAAVILGGRMVYRLVVRAPARSFPAADANRFFDSFRLLGGK